MMSTALEPVRKHGRAAHRRWRHATPAVRALPDFVIVGAQKCGTSALYHYLTQHPGVIGAAKKEVHYFDTAYERGTGWYRAHFPTTRRLERLSQKLGYRAQTGEASPYYLFLEPVAERLHQLLPDTKLVVMLRDPVERAISHHNHSVQEGMESLPLREALAAERDRLSHPDPRARAFSHRHHSYTARGRYAEQLERWLAHFDREQLHVIQSERFFADPGTVVGETLGFLGLPPADLGPYRAIGARARGEAAQADEIAALRATFAGEADRLSRLLDQEFRWEEHQP